MHDALDALQAAGTPLDRIVLGDYYTYSLNTITDTASILLSEVFQIIAYNIHIWVFSYL